MVGFENRSTCRFYKRLNLQAESSAVRLAINPQLSGYDFIPFYNLRDLASGVDLQSIRITAKTHDLLLVCSRWLLSRTLVIHLYDS